MDDFGIRQLASPLTREMLAPLPRTTTRVQFQSALADSEYRDVAKLLEGRPDVTLRRYQYEEVANLDFLRHFPNVRRIALDLYQLRSLEGIDHLPENLATLWIGENARKLRMDRLERFKQLQVAGVDKSVAAVEILAECPSLRVLSLPSVKLPNLKAIRPLRNLEVLTLSLGGTSDLSGLEEVPNLRHLQFLMVRGLADLAPITTLPNLETLELNTLKHVDALPDMSRTPIRRLELQTMRNITDLRPLLKWSTLEICDLVDMKNLAVDDVTVLIEHPRLRSGIVHIGRPDLSDEAARRLGWDRPDELLAAERRRLSEPKLD